MNQAITTSYHLPVNIKAYINDNAKTHKLSKGQFLAYLIEDYQKTKHENQQLKAYFSMATDADFLSEQIAEAEGDLQVELEVNPSLAG